jgi:TRAP-type transport system periplasmic protein
MKKLHFIRWFAFLLSIILFSAPAFANSDDVIEIKVGTVLPAKSRISMDAFEQYGREIEKRTNGRVKFKWFLAGSLVQWPNVKKGLKSGLIDMALCMPVVAVENEYPVTRLLHLPFMVDSPSHAALTYYRAFHEIPEMREEYKDLKPLGFGVTDILDLHTKGDPPKTPADLKGLRVWCGGKMMLSMFKLLGASPRHTQAQDVYMAVQRGMVDAVFFPDVAIRSFKLIEMLSGHTMGSFSIAMQFYAMNLKKWNSLPKDIQKIFEDLILSATCQEGATLTNESNWVMADLKQRGDSFYYLPPEEKQVWKEKLQPLTESYIEALNKKGMDGQAIYNKLLECAEWARQNPYQPDDWWGRTGRK